MGQEWIEIIKRANTAFNQQEYSQASGLFRLVLEETRRNLRPIGLLSGNNIQAVQEFSLCSRVAANALLKDGQIGEAEKIYQIATETLKPFISNLANALLYRALVLSEYKLIFYDLANLYVSNNLQDLLDVYIKENNPFLKKWAEEKQMVSGIGKNFN